MLSFRRKFNLKPTYINLISYKWIKLANIVHFCSSKCQFFCKFCIRSFVYGQWHNRLRFQADWIKKAHFHNRLAVDSKFNFCVFIPKTASYCPPASGIGFVLISIIIFFFKTFDWRRRESDQFENGEINSFLHFCSL